eukprot:1185272-Pyramimonas_sp.AAC.1
MLTGTALARFVAPYGAPPKARMPVFAGTRRIDFGAPIALAPSHEAPPNAMHAATVPNAANGWVLCQAICYRAWSRLAASRRSLAPDWA